MPKTRLFALSLLAAAALAGHASAAPDAFAKAAIDLLMFGQTPFGAPDPSATYTIQEPQPGHFVVEMKSRAKCDSNGVCRTTTFRLVGPCQILWMQTVQGPTDWLVNHNPPDGAAWLRPLGSTVGNGVQEPTTAAIQRLYDLRKITALEEKVGFGWDVTLKGASNCPTYVVGAAPKGVKAEFAKQAVKGACAEPFFHHYKSSGPNVDYLRGKAQTLVEACRRKG
jgi:hypothetical protein